MLFGVIEFGWVFMVHETLTNAAREACRVASLQGSTPTDVETRFQQAMTPTGLTITPGMLTVQYVDTDDPPDGTIDVVNVDVLVPYSEVSITGVSGFLGIDLPAIGSSCSMQKEGS
jgi:Flp pilus assembly protein TadG